MNKFSNMTKDEAIEYCYKHRDKYIRDAATIDEGIRQFDCLVSILDDGIHPSELPDYGMDYGDEE